MCPVSPPKQLSDHVLSTSHGGGKGGGGLGMERRILSFGLSTNPSGPSVHPFFVRLPRACSVLSWVCANVSIVWMGSCGW